MNCPRCSTLLEDQVVAIVDTSHGIVVALHTRVPRHTGHCICGQFTYTVTSTQALTIQPELTLVREVA